MKQNVNSNCTHHDKEDVRSCSQECSTVILTSNYFCIIAIHLGETIGDTLFVHIEKARRDYFGAYQMIVQQFANAHTGGAVMYINREDDSGDLGLRTSKLSYQPMELLDKATVKIKF